jgi:hypothetical protein
MAWTQGASCFNLPLQTLVVTLVHNSRLVIFLKTRRGCSFSASSRSFSFILFRIEPANQPACASIAFCLDLIDEEVQILLCQAIVVERLSFGADRQWLVMPEFER